MTLQAVCDANMIFWDLDMGTASRTHDSAILATSDLHTWAEGKTLSFQWSAHLMAPLRTQWCPDGKNIFSSGFTLVRAQTLAKTSTSLRALHVTSGVCLHR